MTRLYGQIIDAGQTRSLRERPAIPNPPIWQARVSMTAKLEIISVSAHLRLRGPNNSDLSEYSPSRYTCAAVAKCSPDMVTNDTFAIIAITVCSLMLNGPGFKSNSMPPSHPGKRITYMGKAHAIRRPTGYAISLERCQELRQLFSPVRHTKAAADSLRC